MRSSLLFTGVFIALVNNLYGQLTIGNDFSIYYMESGSVYIGKQIWDSRSEISIILVEGDTIRFSKHLVKKYISSKDIRFFENGKFHQINRGFIHWGFGFNGGNIFDENDDRETTSMPLFYGYYLQPNIVVGAGLGFEFHQIEISGFSLDTQFVPVYGYLRYYLSSAKRRPFLYSRIGYGFPAEESELTNDHEGGIQLQLGAGISFASRKKLKFNINLGYHIQSTNGMERFIDGFGNEITTIYDVTIHRLILSVGMEFSHLNRKIH